MTNEQWAVTFADIQAAAERLGGLIRRTPVLPPSGLPDCDAVSVSLKCENLQWGSAFKARGATNAVMSLSAEQAACGVVTHSSGNHAAALARAALQRGIAAHIVMPRNSAAVKLQAVRQLGIEPILCESTAAAREAAAAEVQQRTGA
ncbi:MAG: pyridoxal-phosphate dependent enzyme, partial [Planctomyces sp.]